MFHQHVMFIVNSSCQQQPEQSYIASIGTIIFVAAGVLVFAYLATYGNLAIEISIREEISGTEALKKASELLEGKRKLVAGFVVNVVLGVISVGLFVSCVYLNTCSKLSMDSKKSIMSQIGNFGIFQVEFYTWGCFSILYSICKKSRGETTTFHFQPYGSLQRMLQKEEEPLLPL